MIRRAIALLLVAGLFPGVALAAPHWPNARCVLQAAHAFRVSPWALVGILHVEGGRPGQILYHNTNGSADIGPMQINSLWLPRLAKAGITTRQLADDGCINVAVGAAILATYVRASGGNIGVAIGWYHSHTQPLATRYRLRVARAIERFQTHK